MPLLRDPLAILAVLMLNVVIAEKLAKLPYFRAIGTALIVIIVTAMTANFGLIPSSTNPPAIYDGIFTYLAPISIFFLLLNVNLKSLKKAGSPMIVSFLIGSCGTMIGVLVAMWAVSGKTGFGPLYYALGGMFTGTYIGGGSNLNAVALQYGVNKEGNLYAAAIAVDNIITALWMGVTLLLPQLLNRRFPRRVVSTLSAEETVRFEREVNAQIGDVETVSPQDLAILIGLGVLALYGSQLVTAYLPGVPVILVLTTLALLLAQLPQIQQLRGVRLIGIFCIYLFLAVIGAYCDLGALVKDGQLTLTMLAFVSLLVLVHAVILFGIGAIMRQDWDILSVASQANVGGATSALALTKSLNRADLHLPGILAGALGNAIGTYCGLLMAEYLKTVYG